jgi:hypothetical protein
MAVWYFNQGTIASISLPKGKAIPVIGNGHLYYNCLISGLGGAPAKTLDLVLFNGHYHDLYLIPTGRPDVLKIR